MPLAEETAVKVITRGVIDWVTLEVLEEDSFEYEGPVALAKDSGSAPQPVDPYEQASAQYGLSTGTAAFNAALNRPNSINPVGSTTWGVTGYSGEPSTPSGGYGLGGSGVPLGTSSQTSGSQPQIPTNPLSSTGLTGGNGTAGVMYPNGTTPFGLGGADPYASELSGELGAGAPEYTESTQLAPQFQSILQQPINTAGIPQLSGENLGPEVAQTQNAVFEQNMGYLQPEEQLQSEQLNSQLANEGITPGSAAYGQAEDQLGRQQTFENTQAASGAVTAGENELNNLFGLGGQTLQSEIAYQDQPINEFNSLNGSPGATASATTPDISGAFGQQYQGELAGYNANVATNNANTQAAGGLAALAAYAALFA